MIIMITRTKNLPFLPQLDWVTLPWLLVPKTWFDKKINYLPIILNIDYYISFNITTLNTVYKISLDNKRFPCPQIGQQYGIKNKAAIALQCNSNVKLIAAMIFILYSSFIWGNSQIQMWWTVLYRYKLITPLSSTPYSELFQLK